LPIPATSNSRRSPRPDKTLQPLPHNQNRLLLLFDVKGFRLE
jgi:hypothetical protein